MLRASHEVLGKLDTRLCTEGVKVRWLFNRVPMHEVNEATEPEV